VYPQVLLALSELYQNSSSYLGEEKNNYAKAHNLLSEIVKNYPKSSIHATASNRIKSIEDKSLRTQVEKVYPQGENLLTFVDYKNLNKVFFRLYQLERGKEYELRNRRQDIYKEIKRKKFIKEWNQSLPSFDDFHNHQTEVKIDPLPFGDYVLLTSDGSGFVEEKDLVKANFFVISNLSYIATPTHPNHQLIVMDRLSGNPIKGGKVELFKQEYNPVTRKQVLKKHSDKNGFVNAKIGERDSYMPKVSLGEDVLFIQDWIRKNRNYEQKDRNAVNIFLDR